MVFKDFSIEGKTNPSVKLRLRRKQYRVAFVRQNLIKIKFYIVTYKFLPEKCNEIAF